jgi:asparagine synthase (glutamine-hydrolysing)
MCGIAGIMTRDGAPPPAAALAALADALAHRGPDGEGRHVAGGIGLVHLRLAIIDLATGAQPLFGPGGAALVANGEIYNYVELRAEMAGTPFVTASDCEPPLHIYSRDGLSYVDRLRGMYAIAIADPSEAQLVLSRDPFGIKPLYYAETELGLVFASEPQALLASGLVPRRRNPTAITELLQLQFTTGRETAFEGISRVLPGETLLVGQGRVIERRRRAALPDEGPADWDETTALAKLDAALMDSVAVHERADVPYGLFLSGGVDSSVVLAAMARLSNNPVRAYTAGFPGTAAHDERAHAAEVARAAGADHVMIEVTEDDFWSSLPAIAAAVDDPVADYAIVPTWKLAAEAAKDLKVVLCGEGGDELFAGYGRYRSRLRPWWMGGRAMRPRGILDGLGVLRAAPTGWRDGIQAAERRLERAGFSRLQLAQAVDCADWLPHDLLIKLDRCLMAHALEGRTPLLDPAVADVAFRLPDRLKVRDGKGKYLLRRWLEHNLPAAKPFAPKRGFTVPVGDWIAAKGAKLGPLVAADPAVAELCRPSEVAALFQSRSKRGAMAAWTLLFYALWHRAHLRGIRAEGDVFAALGDSR